MITDDPGDVRRHAGRCLGEHLRDARARARPGPGDAADFLKAISEGTDPTAADKRTDRPADQRPGDQGLRLQQPERDADIQAQITAARAAGHPGDHDHRDPDAGRRVVGAVADGAAACACAPPSPRPPADEPRPGARRAARSQVGGRRLWSQVDLHRRVGEFVACSGRTASGSPRWSRRSSAWFRLAAGRSACSVRPPGRANDRIGYLPQRRSFDAAAAGARGRRRPAGPGRRALGCPAPRRLPVQRPGPSRRRACRRGHRAGRRDAPTPTGRSVSSPAVSSSGCSSRRRLALAAAPAAARRAARQPRPAQPGRHRRAGRAHRAQRGRRRRDGGPRREPDRPAPRPGHLPRRRLGGHRAAGRTSSRPRPQSRSTARPSRCCARSDGRLVVVGAPRRRPGHPIDMR